MGKTGRHTYVIAEIGINHNGSLDNCYKMIDAASDAGCDAAKFQVFKTERLYPKSAGRLDWKDSERAYNYDIYEASMEFELPETWIDILLSYCASRNIDFLCSVFDKTVVDFLGSKGIDRVKLSSYAVTNIPLIEYCAAKGLSVILSTGGATLSEIEEAAAAVSKYHNRLSILHCSIQYPTELRDCNLGVLQTLQLAFPGIDIGWSDHTLEISDAPVQAIYLGAKIIERHITLDKKMDGPDHFFALTRPELKKMVADIRSAETDYLTGDVKINRTIYGSSAKLTYPHEKHLRDFAYMKLYSAREIRKGEIIAPADISILRAGKKKHGLEPKYLELFQQYSITAKRDISYEDPITWDVILS